MWLSFADSLLVWDPTLSPPSFSATCEMAVFARPSHSRSPPWPLSGTALTVALVMATFAFGGAMAQFVIPRDDGDTTARSGLVMATIQDNRTSSVYVNQLNLSLSQDAKSIDVTGNLVLYTAGADRQFQKNDLAFISCDRNATDAFESAMRQATKPSLVVFYTVEHDWCYCHPEEADSGINIFTTLDREQANSFQVLLLQNTDDYLNVRINYDASADESKNHDGQASSSQDPSANQNNSVLGPTPPTSVALIILYSITGLITALFLLIIVIGAFRAHRHPERYGPRPTARLGRPRQSRAKGLARAVLDTLPIVRFGGAAESVETEEEVVKPVDVEMQSGSTTYQVSDENDGERGSAVSFVESQGEVAVAPVVVGDEQEPEIPTIEMDPSQLRCPVCICDFESGQDLRVLPCHHSFHPECIDPWLLNVSGSCPLCRIDLRPEDQRQSLEITPPPPPPPPEPEHTGSRFMRYLDIVGRTSGEERMAALRQLREEQRGASTPRPRSRAPELGISRLRRVFHRRVSGSRSSAASVVEGSATPSLAGGAASSRSVADDVESVRDNEGPATINSPDTTGTGDRRPEGQ